MEELISVIIPVYNVNKYLNKCIGSIVNQTYKNLEIILVDDGSTDNSGEICDEWKQKDSRIKVIHKKNGGQASARNCGIDISKGKYIMFLDADDYIDQNYLLTLVSVAEKHMCDVVCSGQYKVKEDGEIIDSIIYKSYDGKCLMRRFNISGKIYLTSYIKENHIVFPIGKTYEDNSFNLQAFFLTEKSYFLDYAGYYQVVHEGSTTSKVIKTADLPLTEWDNCIEKILRHRDERLDRQLFEFTVLSLFTYLLFVRIRKREYLSNTDKKSNVENATVIAQSFQKIANKYFPYARRNKYTRFFEYNELLLSQKLGVWVFSWMCYFGKLENFTKIFYRLVK